MQTSSRTRMPAGCVCSAPERLSSASLPGVPTTISGLFCFMASTCAMHVSLTPLSRPLDPCLVCRK